MQVAVLDSLNRCHVSAVGDRCPESSTCFPQNSFYPQLTCYRLAVFLKGKDGMSGDLTLTVATPALSAAISTSR